VCGVLGGWSSIRRGGIGRGRPIRVMAVVVVVVVHYY